ncbi:MAG: hypothetical protein WC755_01605 [Candidatus Woesearchaeota archaeon]|jgi:hypothetical protein
MSKNKNLLLVMVSILFIISIVGVFAQTTTNAGDDIASWINSLGIDKLFNYDISYALLIGGIVAFGWTKLRNKMMKKNGEESKGISGGEKFFVFLGGVGLTFATLSMEMFKGITTAKGLFVYVALTTLFLILFIDAIITKIKGTEEGSGFSLSDWVIVIFSAPIIFGFFSFANGAIDTAKINIGMASILPNVLKIMWVVFAGLTVKRTFTVLTNGGPLGKGKVHDLEERATNAIMDKMPIIGNNAVERARLATVTGAPIALKEIEKSGMKMKALLEAIRKKLTVFLSNYAAGTVTDADKTKAVADVIKGLELIKVNEEAIDTKIIEYEKVIKDVEVALEGYANNFVKTIQLDFLHAQISVDPKYENTIYNIFIKSNSAKATVSTIKLKTPAGFNKAVNELKVFDNNKFKDKSEAKRRELQANIDELKKLISNVTSDVSTHNKIFEFVDKLIKTADEGMKLSSQESQEMQKIDNTIKEYQREEKLAIEKYFDTILQGYNTQSKQLGKLKSKKNIVELWTDTYFAEVYETLATFNKKFTAATHKSPSLFTIEFLDGSKTVKIEKYVQDMEGFLTSKPGYSTSTEVQNLLTALGNLKSQNYKKWP